MWTLRAALFTTVSEKKQPKCPSTDEWINNKVIQRNISRQQKKKIGLSTDYVINDGAGGCVH